MTPLMGTATQWGYVVRDIHAAMRYWTDILGVGPFVLIPRRKSNQQIMTYRGQETQVEISIAFSYCGATQIELVQQLNDAPSPYLDFLAAGREGLQHFCFWTERYDEAYASLESAGHEAVYRIRLENAVRDTVYFETDPAFGPMIELSLMTPRKRAFFDAMKTYVETAQDGEPVKVFESLDAFAANLGVTSPVSR